MQELETLVQTEVDAEWSRPVNIVEIALNAGTLRYAATNVNIVFPTGGNTYTAKAMDFGNIKGGINDQIEECDVALDNVSADMQGYNAAEPFDGKRLTWKKIYRNVLGSALYYAKKFDGYMTEPDFTKQWCRIKCVRGKSLDRRLLTGIYAQECQNMFGDAKCNYSGFANLTSLTASGTADSGTVSTLTDSDLTQVDDAWNFGRIEITISGIVYHRRIVDFDAATDTLYFDVPLHTAVSAGNAYQVWRGCNKTRNCCNAAYAYGPAASNVANFRGCQHIGGAYAEAALGTMTGRGVRWRR